MLINSNQISTLHENEAFLAYKGASDKNLLFLGSCRLLPIAYYFHNLYPKYNIYIIYVPFWNPEKIKTFPREIVATFVKNTEMIFTETIKNFSILNTDTSIAHNFYETFVSQDLPEFRISNLELAMYAYDIKHIYKYDLLNLEDHFNKSYTRLTTSLIKHKFLDVNILLANDLKTIKLFSTHNHPTTILSLCMFKNLIKKMNLNNKLSFEFIKNISRYDFLGGNSTPITTLDIKHYQFNFATTIHDESIINTTNYIYKPLPSEHFITDQLIETYLM